MIPSRRGILAAGLAGMAGAGGLAAWHFWPEQGVLNPCLGPLPASLAAHPMVRDAWAGLDPAYVWDMHAHLLGVGDHGTAPAAGINDYRGSLRWPLAAAQRTFFLNAGCATGTGIDLAYIQRLRSLVEAMPAGHKLVLLALDRWHGEDGLASNERTHAWVGNRFCAAVARASPARFEWIASVHPYRKDAVQELEQAKQWGARAVKWIPSAQGIDPASPRCDAFYAALARLGLPLLTHAGSERAAPGDEELGNPLRLRRPLEQGVRVVVSHCASMGESRDIDRGPEGPWTDNFDLFERLMGEPAHLGRLYGDISAITQSARAGALLRRILERAGEFGSGIGLGDWVGRILNGSDYPLPAIMPLYSPRQLVEAGYLDESAVEPLTEIRRHNALLFDFVLKRHLRVGGRQLSSRVFETRRFFAPG